MMPSPLYCDACGAANRTQTTLCWACGQLLAASTEQRRATSATSTGSAGPPTPAALLAGRYRIIGMVGMGGYGAVYKAEDVQRHDALVAIKSINLHGLRSEKAIEATETFNREMLLLSQLRHPNLPCIHDHFTDREHWYLAMDFIAGETLDEYLSKVSRGYLAVETVVDIGIQLCEVLSYLHSQQPPIIFRDVKPANVMRTVTGHLYLIDFGIARRFRPGQKHDTTVLGSPGYAPPEQYGSAQTTVQSDIYSLGATLRYLLTGEDASEGLPSPASSYNQEVPGALQHLLVQMLEWDASKRPASMSGVKLALQQIDEERRLRDRVGLMTIGGGLTLSALTQGSQSPQTSSGLYSQVPPAPHLLYTYRGHTNPVSAVAWSPDGKRIASASWDNTVQVWDAADGGNIFTYRGHPNQVWSVAWSPDGRHIASRGYDSTVQVWDATTGGHVYTYHGHSLGANAVAWSPNGKRIVSGSQLGTVQVWNATTGGHVYTYSGHSGIVEAVAWSPDGKRIASGSADNTVQVWDAITGGHVYTYRGHSDGVNAVAWSPDGKRIVSGSADSTVQMWDAADGGHVYTYRGYSAPVYAVAWSPDGKRIASGSFDKTVQVRVAE